MTIKLIIHQEQLTQRGDSVNAENISLLLRTIYGIESIVVAPNSSRNNYKRIADMRALGIRVEIYRNLKDLWNISKRFRTTHAYYLTDGTYSNTWIPDTYHLVHAVFKNFQPHGHKYAYVSKWLFNKAKKLKINPTLQSSIETQRKITQSPYGLDLSLKTSWVPQSVVPKPIIKGTFKKYFSIPRSVKVIARIGGYDQFNDLSAIHGIRELIFENPKLYFVFVNTKNFIQASNVMYIDYLSEELKWGMYSDCDLFINARSMGETFGFSIMEPLMIGKPVLAPDQLRHPRMDAHHMKFLRKHHLTYLNKTHFKFLVKRYLEYPPDEIKLIESVAQFTPENATKSFYNYFLT